MILTFDAKKFSHSVLSQITTNRGILRNPINSGFRKLRCFRAICEMRDGWVSFICELAVRAGDLQTNIFDKCVKIVL
jgi:hypothetical protein